MTVLALNAGRLTVSAAVPPDSGTVPSVTTWPLCGPLDSLSANTTDPVAADGVTVAVSVTGVPNVTDAADAVNTVEPSRALPLARTLRTRERSSRSSWRR